MKIDSDKAKRLALLIGIGILLFVVGVIQLMGVCYCLVKIVIAIMDSSGEVKLLGSYIATSLAILWTAFYWFLLVPDILQSICEIGDE